MCYFHYKEAHLKNNIKGQIRKLKSNKQIHFTQILDIIISNTNPNQRTVHNNNPKVSNNGRRKKTCKKKTKRYNFLPIKIKAVCKPIKSPTKKNSYLTNILRTQKDNPPNIPTPSGEEKWSDMQEQQHPL